MNESINQAIAIREMYPSASSNPRWRQELNTLLVNGTFLYKKYVFYSHIAIQICTLFNLNLMIRFFEIRGKPNFTKYRQTPNTSR